MATNTRTNTRFRNGSSSRINTRLDAGRSGSRVDNRSAYPADLTSEPEGGFTVTFPGFPGATYGDTQEAAITAAKDLLEEMVLGLMAHGREVADPPPAEGRPLVALPALCAAKLEVYRAMRAEGLTKSQLAARLGWQPSEVTRLFDGYHATRLDKIEEALEALGRRLTIASETK